MGRVNGIDLNLEYIDYLDLWLDLRHFKTQRITPEIVPITRINYVPAIRSPSDLYRLANNYLGSNGNGKIFLELGATKGAEENYLINR